MFEFTKKNMKSIMVIITFAIVLCWLLFNFPIILSMIGNLVYLLLPFILGLSIAFILNIPVRIIEKRLLKIKKRKNKNAKITPINRICTILISLILVSFVIFFVFFLIIPELINTFDLFIKGVPEIAVKTQAWLSQMTESYPSLNSKINNVNWNTLDEGIKSYLKNGVGGVVTTSITVVISIITSAVTFFMGLIFALYVLGEKEKLLRQLNRFVYAFFSKKAGDKIIKVGKVTNDRFYNFISGQLMESCILGVLCFIGMNILNLPYATTISIVVGVLSLIPLFGAFIGAAIGTMLLLVVNPLQALIFIIFFLVLQQIEGNLIYPRVVGNSVGLPPMWVMFAVTVGGGVMGVLGMFIGVPVVAIIYILLGEAIQTRLDEKKVENKSI